MNITRFAVHFVTEGTLAAAVSGQTHVVEAFLPHIAELVTGYEGSTIMAMELEYTMAARIKSMVAASDMRRAVIPTGHHMEIVITPMCSVMGGA